MKITSNVPFSLSLYVLVAVQHFFIALFYSQTPRSEGLQRDQMITHIYTWLESPCCPGLFLYYSVLSAAKASKPKGTMFMYQMEHIKIHANAYIANISFIMKSLRLSLLVSVMI